jgi:hypothetical protein
MTEKDSIYVPISFEFLMSSLFGKTNYHGYVGSVRQSIWKKDLIKIVKYIKKSIIINANTDHFHKSELIKTCNTIEEKIKKSKSFDEINLETIEGFIRLVFLLLGNMPNHWDRKSPYLDKFWELDGHRTLIYSQSDEQKVYLIINLVDIRKQFSIKVEDYENLSSLFYKRFRENASEFLSWFKDSYPETYCQIF